MNPQAMPQTWGKVILEKLLSHGFSVTSPSQESVDADPNSFYLHLSGRRVSLGYSAVRAVMDRKDSPLDEELSLFFGDDMRGDAHITALLGVRTASVTKAYLPQPAEATFSRYQLGKRYPTSELVNTLVDYFLAYEQPPSPAPLASPPKLHLVLGGE